MKKPFLLFIFFLFFIFNVKGQNLVPNGDFETFTSCPTTISQIDSAIPWRVPTSWSSTDYYNQCSVNVGVPVNGGSGYQPAHSGGAYSGMYLIYFGAPDREYLEAPLTQPLTANQCYHFEMYVNLINYSRYSTSTIGAYLSDTLLSNINSDTALSYIPQMNNTAGNFFDTLNWTLVSINYTAQGGESFITIGNFKDNANTDTTEINPSGLDLCYVYIDDVSLTPCTGIEEQNQNDAIKIYPNPVKDELTVSSKQFGEKAEIKITDATGRIVLQQTANLQSSIFNLQSFQSGIYFLEINDGKNIFRKKFFKVD